MPLLVLAGGPNEMRRAFLMLSIELPPDEIALPVPSRTAFELILTKIIINV
jgi:hypothetical protein